MMMSLELEQLHLAEEVAGFGSFSWEIEGNVYHWSRGMYTLLEIPPTEPPSMEAYLRRVPAEDHAMVRDGFAQAVAGMARYQREYRLVFDNGRTKWVRATGAPRRMSNGHRVVVGVVQDITRQMEDRIAVRQLNEELLAMVERNRETIDMLGRYRRILDA